MNVIRKGAGCALALSTLLGAALLNVGCHTDQPVYQPLPPGVPGPPAAAATNGSSPLAAMFSDKFRKGDQVTVNFAGSTVEQNSVPLLPHKEAIKEDGTISPPMVGSVVAAGRTPGELQSELQEKYKKLFKNMTVTVLPADRYYYVAGEVRKPGPEPYLGETDIIKAIAAALDFTDYANKKKVILIRANGQKEIINVQKIINGGADVPIYPGDKIVVKRRLL